MGFKSARDMMMYEEFKKEVTFIRLKSTSSNKVKKIIKWRDKTIYTGSIKEAFLTNYKLLDEEHKNKLRNQRVLELNKGNN